jgi:hypothetical protein
MADKTQAEKLETLVREATEKGCNKAGSLSMDGWLVAIRDYPNDVDWNALIFNHDFARALFGNFPTYVHDGYMRFDKGEEVQSWLGRSSKALKDEEFTTGALSYSSWQYHVMQALIADDPIGYMYEAVFGGGH